MLYLLDTDVASYIIKARSAVAAVRMAAIPPEDVAISAVTRGELLYGLRRLEASHPLHSVVQHFLGIIRVQDWPAAAAGHYAEIRYQLASTGQPIGELDMMIAAHALALNATLVTNNLRHYQRIAHPPRLENWTL